MSGLELVGLGAVARVRRVCVLWHHEFAMLCCATRMFASLWNVRV